MLKIFIDKCSEETLHILQVSHYDRQLALNGGNSPFQQIFIAPLKCFEPIF